MGTTRRAFLATGTGLGLGALVSGNQSFASPDAYPTGRPRSPFLRANSRGHLTYPRDAEGNRIPDFSCAGYRRGEVPIPNVPVVRTISPIDGDNTAHIQAALDAVGALPQDVTGFRGAVQLTAGTYPVYGTIKITRDGVVLRGVGDDEDPSANTVIRAIGDTPTGRYVVVLGGGPGGWSLGEIPGTRTDITSDLVQVGERSFTVADPSLVRPGDTIIVNHPCSAAWLTAVDGGGTHTDPPWDVDEWPIRFNRDVVDVSGSSVTVDTGVFNHLDRSLSQCYVYRWEQPEMVRNVGVEGIRVDIEYLGDPDTDEAHARSAFVVQQARDAWVRDCTGLHFVYAGVDIRTATQVTVANCRALRPVSLITGSRRYNFNVSSYSSQVLFSDCHASDARHAFVSNGTGTASGLVFLRGSSERSLATSEGHRSWTQGMLFDNHREIDPRVDTTVGLFNRGSAGDGHGWAAVHSVAWKCDVAGTKLVVQKPPTAQNYAIGCFGTTTGDGPFVQPAGHIEGSNDPSISPPSLYEAQLADRLLA
ncbi:hypothetical protein ABN028_33145 [Actinopolymorpha sp. B17G11]|uniref:hypothetical protein n=1 Tax=Actinopolymorpha sp. B17G11 TaxID=3160861 RepID=UPI0032E49A81